VTHAQRRLIPLFFSARKGASHSPGRFGETPGGVFFLFPGFPFSSYPTTKGTDRLFFCRAVEAEEAIPGCPSYSGPPFSPLFWTTLWLWGGKGRATMFRGRKSCPSFSHPIYFGDMTRDTDLLFPFFHNYRGMMRGPPPLLFSRERYRTSDLRDPAGSFWLMIRTSLFPFFCKLIWYEQHRCCGLVPLFFPCFLIFFAAGTNRAFLFFFLASW